MLQNVDHSPRLGCDVCVGAAAALGRLGFGPIDDSVIQQSKSNRIAATGSLL
jgi:hypothetical protein